MNGKRPSVAVMGAGGLGCYYGARLMQACLTVHFIARGATLAALAEQGLQVHRDDETIHFPNVSATDRAADVGPVDLLLFTTKGHHLADALPACSPLVGDDTVVLPLLNGMDISERIAAGLSHGSVLGAVTYLPAKVTAPGIVRQAGVERMLTLGALDPAHEDAAQWAESVLRNAGIAVERSPDVRSAIWTKSIAFTAFAGAQCAFRLPSGGILQDANASALFDGLIREGQSLAAAVGVSVPEDLHQRLHAALAAYPHDHTISLYDDLQAGRPLELDTTLGALVALGERLGVPTPMTSRAFEAIRPFAAGSSGSAASQP